MRALSACAFLILHSTVAVVAHAVPEGTCGSAEEATCSSSPADAADGATAEIDCVSHVRLFDEYPSDVDGQPPEDDGSIRSISLVDNDDQIGILSRVSRYGADNKLRQLTDDRLFHISPNGDHTGWVVYVPSDQCWHEAKQLVARQIVNSPSYKSKSSALNNDLVTHVDTRGPHRLVDQEGRIYPHHTNSHHLHLLLPRESFIHEAVEEGFRRTLSGGTVIETVSLSPRVFVSIPS